MKRHRTKITPELIDQIVSMAKEDINITEIAKQLNINRSSIYRYLRTHLPDREYQMHKEVTEEELNTIRTLYLTQGMTPTDISYSTGINILRINHILDNYNIRKPKTGAQKINMLNVKMPEKVEDPLYYPERKATPKRYTDRGKKYIDVSEVYGL